MRLPEFEYPWHELGSIPDRHADSMILIGYGSLLNSASALRSLPEGAVRSSRPVTAVGVRRVFEYVIPRRSLDRYPRVVGTDERAALNVRFTGDPEHTINGRAFVLSRDQVLQLREREFGYDLLPVPFVPFGDDDSPVEYGYVLSCRRSTLDGRELLSQTIEPHPEYLEVCLIGAAEVSLKFQEEFLKSTYLVNGQSLSEGTKR